MKKIIASASLAALSVAALQAAAPSGPSNVDPSRNWSVSGTLRGFYDDNYRTMPSTPGNPKLGSYGVEVIPGADLLYNIESTTISLGYKYDLKYYDNRYSQTTDSTGVIRRSTSDFDQSHFADLKINHAFSEEYSLDLKDSFAATKEPELLYANSAAQNTRVLSKNALRNNADAIFKAKVSRLLTLTLGGGLDWLDYGEQSYAKSLDQLVPRASLKAEYTALENLQPFLNYGFGYVAHTYDDTPNAARWQNPDARDQMSNKFSVGTGYSFLRTLVGAVEGGVELTSYPSGIADDNVGPYAKGTLTYSYDKQNSYLQLGVLHERAQTEYINYVDQEVTRVFGVINHHLDDFTFNVLAGYQYGDLNGTLQSASGVNNSSNSQNYYYIGANVSYKINEFVSAEVGYNYDYLSSEASQTVTTGTATSSFWNYNRNRVYLGVCFKY